MPGPAPLVVKNFISGPDKRSLEAHAIVLFTKGVLQSNQSGPNRFFLTVSGTAYSNPLIERIGARVRKLIASGDVETDPELGWVISYIEPGGFVHPHTDSSAHYTNSGRKHIRGNVMVSKNPGSDNPVINGRVYPVDEKDLWMFCASDDSHACETVKGPKARIVYQFGFSVRMD